MLIHCFFSYWNHTNVYEWSIIICNSSSGQESFESGDGSSYGYSDKNRNLKNVLKTRIMTKTRRKIIKKRQERRLKNLIKQKLGQKKVTIQKRKSYWGNNIQVNPCATEYSNKTEYLLYNFMDTQIIMVIKYQTDHKLKRSIDGHLV